MKKTIGYKSKGFSIINAILLIIFIGYAIALLSGPAHPFMVIQILFILLLGIYVIIRFFEHLNQPINVISYDDSYLYINDGDHEEKIAILSIEHTQAKSFVSKYMIYTFGRVEIHTKDGIFITGYVSNVEYVAKKISKMVNQKKEIRFQHKMDQI